VVVVRFELSFYIPENDILHSRRRRNLKFYSLSDILVRLIQPLGETLATCLHRNYVLIAWRSFCEFLHLGVCIRVHYIR
jgi:hypothetical protein